MERDNVIQINSKEVLIGNFPKKAILLDINGTLFPDESIDGYIDPKKIQILQEKVTALAKIGYTVGFCTDSPLEPVKELATKLGIQGPIIAENGNVVSVDDDIVIINPLSEIEGFKREITFIGNELQYVQKEDCLSSTFGGGPEPNFLKQEWAFGAYRKASISVFGPRELIVKLEEKFQNLNNYSYDCSPQYNFFALHPGSDYKRNKGKTLSVLADQGLEVIMVGNSLSDWVDPNSGVKCAFVSNSILDRETMAKAHYISDLPTIDGVIDILSHIVEQNIGKIYGATLLETKSGYNNNVAIWEGSNGEKFVTKTLSKSRELPSIELQKLSPFITEDKIQKEVKLTKVLTDHNFPIPRVIFYDSATNSAGYEFVEGNQFDFKDLRNHLLPEDIENRIISQLAQIIVRLQEIPVKTLESFLPGKYDFSNPSEKHKWRLTSSLTYLYQHEIISTDTITKILKITEPLLRQLPSTEFSLTHGDLYTGNIFVNNNSEISTVIDWGDASEVDDSLTDLILTARWLAFDSSLTNLQDPKAQNIFLRCIENYSHYSGKNLNPEICFQLIPLFDILWHLRVLTNAVYLNDISSLQEFSETLGNILR